MIEVLTATNRMRDYLPLYWHEYKEMIELLKSQGFEIEYLNKDASYILVDAFILDMREERIIEWERWLKLPPNGTLDDRRLAILNYFAVASKMSRESIQAVVAAMYDGAKADVFFKDSTIHVIIKPPAGYIETPAITWNELKNSYDEWGDILTVWGVNKVSSNALEIGHHKLKWSDVRSSDDWQWVKDNAENWGSLLPPENQWITISHYRKLYNYLYARKPAHLKLLIERFKPNWDEVNFAKDWGTIRNSANSWQELTFRTWEK